MWDVLFNGFFKLLYFSLISETVRTVNEYFGFITMMMLGAGLIFEMPMVSFILARFNIITAKMLRKYWRHAIVAILILAAVLTPSPDPINQMIFATPLFILYEISIWIAKLAERKTKNTEE